MCTPWGNSFELRLNKKINFMIIDASINSLFGVFSLSISWKSSLWITRVVKEIWGEHGKGTEKRAKQQN